VVRVPIPENSGKIVSPVCFRDIDQAASDPAKHAARGLRLDSPVRQIAFDGRARRKALTPRAQCREGSVVGKRDIRLPVLIDAMGLLHVRLRRVQRFHRLCHGGYLAYPASPTALF